MSNENVTAEYVTWLFDAPEPEWEDQSDPENYIWDGPYSTRVPITGVNRSCFSRRIIDLIEEAYCVCENGETCERMILADILYMPDRIGEEAYRWAPDKIKLYDFSHEFGWEFIEYTVKNDVGPKYEIVDPQDAINKAILKFNSDEAELTQKEIEGAKKLLSLFNEKDKKKGRKE